MTNINDTIREVFLAHGFTIKDGQTDLKPYVYEAVHALLSKLCAPVADEKERRQQAGIEVMGWLRENHAPHSIYSRMSACLFGDPDWPKADAALASAPVAGEAQRLDAPAQVGGTRFGKGIHWSTVIHAAQRHHEYMQDPAREAERIAQAKKFQALVAGDAAPQASEAVRDQDLAPWPDYAGNPIRHGDRIRHPEGLEGVVVRLSGYADAHDAWCVAYQDRTVSRLSLQIGERGQAAFVTYRAALSAQPGKQDKETDS